METKKVFTVSNVNKYIKMVFDKDPFLSYVAIKGEITNFKALQLKVMDDTESRE